jgi:hypothetical protein
MFIEWEGEIMPISKNKYGNDFLKSEIDAVWNKGSIVAGYDSRNIRKDMCGSYIQYSAYGDVNSKYGWEIDHIKPLSKGGSDDFSNLQPLHWRTNRDKADNYPWRCPR